MTIRYSGIIHHKSKSVWAEACNQQASPSELLNTRLGCACRCGEFDLTPEWLFSVVDTPPKQIWRIGGRNRTSQGAPQIGDQLTPETSLSTCSAHRRRELINHTLPPIVSAPNFVMRSRKTSLTYRLLSRHQERIIVSIYLCGLFLKTRKAASNENENLFEHKTPCPGFTSKCLSSAQTAFRSVG